MYVRRRRSFHSPKSFPCSRKDATKESHSSVTFGHEKITQNTWHISEEIGKYSCYIESGGVWNMLRRIILARRKRGAEGRIASVALWNIERKLPDYYYAGIPPPPPFPQSARLPPPSSSSALPRASQGGRAACKESGAEKGTSSFPPSAVCFGLSAGEKRPSRKRVTHPPPKGEEEPLSPTLSCISLRKERRKVLQSILQNLQLRYIHARRDFPENSACARKKRKRKDIQFPFPPPPPTIELLNF